MEKKIRILGIAPYEGMKTMMEKVSLDFPQIELVAVEGDLEQGVEVAQDNFHANYDVIISRGGTAQMLRQRVDLPVVEIPTTEYDILRALHLAEHVAKEFAIIGFSNIIENAAHISGILSVTLNQFTIHGLEDAEDAVQQAWDCGYRTVLCDVVASVAAKRHGMNAILITSGSESIIKAINDALLLCTALEKLRTENQFLRDIISGQSNETVVYDMKKNLYFSTVTTENRNAVISMLKNEIDHCDDQTSTRMIKSLDGLLYTIKAKKISLQDHMYTIFYFSRSKIPFSSSKSGIRYYSRQQAQQFFYDSFYSSAGFVGGLGNNISQLSQSSNPVMLIGEDGTGKETVASMLYSRSSLHNHPFISINCSLLDDKSWDYLISSHNSPFADSQITLYISQIDALPKDKSRQMLAALIDMNVCRRNRVIFSCVQDSTRSLPEVGTLFADKLCCLMLALPALREQKEHIPALINLYLSQLGITQPNSVVGMSEEAIRRMQNYGWPHNLAQFKRVLQEMVATSTSAIIPEEAVDRVLRLEETSPIAHGKNTEPLRFDLNRTLSEMETELVLRVLDECDGNQSAAAKRLGISRTTLWRYCQKQ